MPGFLLAVNFRAGTKAYISRPLPECTGGPCSHGVTACSAARAVLCLSGRDLG